MSNDFLLHIADYFFVVFHTALTLFNCLGWIWRKTRLANLVTLTLTGLSWFVLGLFYGIGYCPLTDWHFNVLEALGNRNLPVSYISYIIERVSGFLPDAGLVESATGIVFLFSFILSLFLNIRQIYRKIRTGTIAKSHPGNQKNSGYF